jgi:hypothetical protein
LLSVAGCGATGPTRVEPEGPEPEGPTQVVPTSHKETLSHRDEPAGTRPTLVVAVVIDQLGSDALAKLEPLLLEQDGLLARTLREGRRYQLVYPYAATLTAPGHAALFSGAAPNESGVTTNYVVDATTGQRRDLVDDRTHAVLGVSDAFASPSVLLVPTVGDALKDATQGRGKVVSLSIKDRSAILPGGKRPDLALWYEPSARGFTTSAYYAKELPAWLVRHQHAHPITPERVVWSVRDPERLRALLGPDDAKGESDVKGLGIVFPHELARAKGDPYELFGYVPAAADALLALALAAVRELQLGQDETPDLLAISISSTDYTGHAFGPDSWEYADHVRHVDLALASFVRALEQRARVAVLVSADHGVAPLPERAVLEHPGAKRIDGKALAREVDSALDGAFGPGDYVSGYVEPYVYLTPFARSHAKGPAVRALALEKLRGHPAVLRAFDTARLEPPADAIAEAVRLSVHPATSGDFYVVLQEYVFAELSSAPGAGTTHGSPHRYDTHVPALLLAPGLRPGGDATPHDVRQFASTLAALLGIAPPEHALRPPLP